MKLLLIFFCSLLMPYKALCQITVNIQITQTSSYCGGAAPPQELIEQLNTPVPLTGKVIYLRKGETNQLCRKTIELKSDENGNIITKLKPGFYAVVDESKKDKAFYNNLLTGYSKSTENYSEVDKACLDKWLNEPQQVIEVLKEGDFFQINFHQPCPWNAFPCVQYKGLLPQ